MLVELGFELITPGLTALNMCVLCNALILVYITRALHIKNIYMCDYMSREKTNILVSASSIEPDQLKHSAQANLDRHFSPHVDFQFYE